MKNIFLEEHQRAETKREALIKIDRTIPHRGHDEFQSHQIFDPEEKLLRLFHEIPFSP
jgi:hypothetical protein